MQIKTRTDFGMMGPDETKRLIEAIMGNAAVRLFLAASDSQNKVARNQEDRGE